jgi:hypothetical protein
MAKRTFPCPCCGYLMFEEGPGSYDICKICFWEDDDVQLRDPHFGGGANVLSLLESQRNFEAFGATEQRFLVHVRPPNQSDSRDPGWTPADPVRHNLERSLPEGGWETPWPKDLTELYWWRPTYWRKPNRG